jgi:hypothetical protein
MAMATGINVPNPHSHMPLGAERSRVLQKAPLWVELLILLVAKFLVPLWER